MTHASSSCGSIRHLTSDRTLAPSGESALSETRRIGGSVFLTVSYELEFALTWSPVTTEQLTNAFYIQSPRLHRYPELLISSGLPAALPSDLRSPGPETLIASALGSSTTSPSGSLLHWLLDPLYRDPNSSVSQLIHAPLQCSQCGPTPKGLHHRRL